VKRRQYDASEEDCRPLHAEANQTGGEQSQVAGGNHGGAEQVKLLERQLLPVCGGHCITKYVVKRVAGYKLPDWVERSIVEFNPEGRQHFVGELIAGNQSQPEKEDKG